MRLRRFRERLVLGAVDLDRDEVVRAWTHAAVPSVRAPAVLLVTDRRLILHVASMQTPDIWAPLSQLSSFTLDRRDPETVLVRLVGQGHEVAVELSLTSRVRSRSAGRVLSTLVQRKIAGPDGFDHRRTSPIPPMERGVRHHARRVWVTTLGVLVLVLSAVFASPFVPGPGALTAVAGIAILAREYEWARDLHVWASRQADKFVSWLRRRAGRPARPRRADAATAGPSRPVFEAEVPIPGDGAGREDAVES